MAESSRCLPSQELEGVWVLFLRHQTRPRRVRICNGNEAKFRRTVKNQVLAPPRDVIHDHGPNLEKFGDEISVLNGTHRVPEDAFKAQLLSHHMAIDFESISGKSTASKGATFAMLAGSRVYTCFGDEEDTYLLLMRFKVSRKRSKSLAKENPNDKSQWLNRTAMAS